MDLLGIATEIENKLKEKKLVDRRFGSGFCFIDNSRVLNIDIPMTGFSYWIMATFITEMMIWTLFILEYEWVPEQKRSKKCKK